MYMKPKFKLIIMLLCLMLLFISCASKINGSLAADGSAVLTVNVSLQTRMAALIKKLSEAGGAKVNDNMILNSQNLSQSMSAAPGVASAVFKNTAPADIEGPIRISRIGDFLAAGSSENFITYEQSAKGGRCIIRLRRENGPKIIGFISPEITNYLNALMAPIATGEELNKKEYLDLVKDVYNKGISDEIASSRIIASVNFPGQITAVKGGTFSGKRADFNIPLLDLLVLDSPLQYEVSWE